MEWFKQSAIRYKLCGHSLEELCEINASVAFGLDRVQVAMKNITENIVYSMFNMRKFTFRSLFLL